MGAILDFEMGTVLTIVDGFGALISQQRYDRAAKAKGEGSCDCLFIGNRFAQKSLSVLF
jgi:hypothetical protein